MTERHLNTFDDFYAIAPSEIKDYIDKCENIPQSIKWHPEFFVGKHIRIVFNRARRTGDINFMLAALFHDLGKATTTVPHPTMKNSWSTKFHEKVSARLVKENREWIESLGANFDIVFYIVDQHMRAKQIHQMRPFKREKFMSERYYPYVQAFTEFDNMKIDYTNDIND
jgi:hypothetical protein